MERDSKYFVRSCADAFSNADIGGPFVIHHHTQPTSNAFIDLNIISARAYSGVTKDSIPSQRYITPRAFAVNNVTLPNVAPSILYRVRVHIFGHNSKGSNDRLQQRSYIPLSPYSHCR